MDSQSESQIYQPFENGSSFRIIRVLPGRREDEIQIRLVTSTIGADDMPAYVALSYAWEGQTPSKEIACNGKPFLVTKNCFEALMELRLEDEERLMWIDAICINQDAVMERGHQVSIMGEIYRNAAEVAVWLGQKDEKMGHLYSWFRAFDSQLNELELPDTLDLSHRWPSRLRMDLTETMDNYNVPKAIVRNALLKIHVALSWRIIYNDDNNNNRVFKKYIQKVDGISDWERPVNLGDFLELKTSEQRYRLIDGKRQVFELMSVLLARSWFQRTWTVQEVMFSRNCRLFCGGDSISWTRFLNICSNMEHTGFTNQYRRLSIYDITREVIWHGIPPSLEPSKTRATNQRNPGGSTVLTMIMTCVDREVSDPRDRIFAMHSLLQAANISLPKPDYQKDTVTVFMDTAIAEIERTRSLNVLLHASITQLHVSMTILKDYNPKSSVFPSWVPNWEPKSPYGWLHGSGREEYLLFPELEVLRPSIRGTIRTYIPRYKATNGSQLDTYSLADDNKTLVLQGYRLDTISFSCIVPSEFLSELNLEWKMRAPISELTGRTYQASTKEAGWVLYLSLVKDLASGPDGKPLTDLMETCLKFLELEEYDSMDHVTKEAYDLFLGYIWGGESGENEMRPEQATSIISQMVDDVEARGFHKAFQWLVFRRRLPLLKTTSGRVVATPFPAGVGDEVWLLPGLDVPVVLRPTAGTQAPDDSADVDVRYRLIGSTFITGGIMDGTEWSRLTSQTNSDLMRTVKIA